MQSHALIALLIALSLTACGTERIVPQPVPVEVEGPTKYLEVPAGLLIQHRPTTIPSALTYRHALKLWNEDRAMIKKQNGQLQSIQSLEIPE